MILTASARHSQAVTCHREVRDCDLCTLYMHGGTRRSTLTHGCIAEAHTRHMKNVSCTSNPCEWLPPSLHNVSHAPISDINFSAPSTEQRKILLDKDEPSRRSDEPSRKSESKASDIVAHPAEEELNNFYHKLSQTRKPVIPTITPGYSDAYVSDYNKYSIIALQSRLTCGMMNF